MSVRRVSPRLSASPPRFQAGAGAGLDAPEESLPRLLKEIRGCRICEAHLPLGPRPIVRASVSAQILVAGQAPGARVHATGVPWDDRSGDRLRDWLGVDGDTFYDERRFALVPMGFCYPGPGRGGDAPPRPECAAAWRSRLLAQLPAIRLTLLIGAYAQAWHLGERRPASLSATVQAWSAFSPTVFPLPHPSPRNQRWVRDRPWFDSEVIPALQRRVRECLQG